eukprot:GAFH01005890.1.p2 GENE.GAFH01005890.1~~GAFH01005890.1.p2  ORF type:complete len:96 (-),score=4.81 GAFH01005890.1:111-398(-)
MRTCRRPCRASIHAQNHDSISGTPEMNFIGMLLGPRGVVLKMIENDSGTKVAIRGKPATRDVNDSDELHVLIRGPSEEAVEKAAGMVLSIITPPS